MNGAVEAVLEALILHHVAEMGGFDLDYLRWAVANSACSPAERTCGGEERGTSRRLDGSSAEGAVRLSNGVKRGKGRDKQLDGSRGTR